MSADPLEGSERARQEFEKWGNAKGAHVEQSWNGEFYENKLVESAWQGWQARGRSLEQERDEAVSWIRIVGEELVLAGYPAGDRTVILANIRAAIRKVSTPAAPETAPDAPVSAGLWVRKWLADDCIPCWDGDDDEVLKCLVPYLIDKFDEYGREFAASVNGAGRRGWINAINGELANLREWANKEARRADAAEAKAAENFRCFEQMEQAYRAAELEIEKLRAETPRKEEA